MKEEIRELRRQLPIPMGEAMTLLRENECDVEKCVYLFKAKTLRYICEQTACDLQMAGKHYEVEKFDLDRTISSIEEELFDLNYKPIAGLTKEMLQKVQQWIWMIEDKDLAYSLDYPHLDEVEKVLSFFPQFSALASDLHAVRRVKEEIFEGYGDHLPMADFVRRHAQLDSCREFQAISNFSFVTFWDIKDELRRHIRNL